MTRHEERECLFSLLYEYTYFEGIDAEAFIEERRALRETDFSDYITVSFIETQNAIGEIDKIIADYAVGWKVKRMSRVTCAILRLAVYELTFTDTPAKAVINEAVELGKAYDEQKTVGFINGVLNNYARSEGKIVLSDNQDGSEK